MRQRSMAWQVWTIGAIALLSSNAARAGLPTACVGDCSGNGVVTVNELYLGINIALGLGATLDQCPSFDTNGDGSVSVADLLKGVHSAFNGCIGEAVACEQAAAGALSTCVAALNAAQLDCYQTAGSACAPDDAAVTAALATLEDDVLDACLAPDTVQASGYGPASTPAGVASRLAAACRAETASLAARTFGGPQGAALAAGTAAAVACLEDAHAAGAELLSDEAALYDTCLATVRYGGTCDPVAVAAEATALRDAAVDAIETSCGRLERLVAVDAATYANRAAAQARCLTAIAHPSSAPLSLDCGPRAGIVEAPRGEYVQVVLEESVWGTRCGDGSPFAFWLRLAPEGAPVENVVVGMQGGGVCVFGADCATRPATLFEALSDAPETGGPLSNDPEVSPFADWTKLYLPYCNQDVFIGGGTTSDFPQKTVHRFGAVNVRAALRYTRDVVWGELQRTTADGYDPDHMRVLFGGFSAGGFGTLYNYHYVLDDLQWEHTVAYPDAGLALDNGEALSVAALGALVISDVAPLGWSAQDYLPPYCFATNCGVGPVLLEATAPRLLAVPEQQMLILSNQVDDVQVGTTYFASIVPWVNEMRSSYCETRDLPGVQYYLPAITESVHVVSPRQDLYTDRPVDGVIMRDWLASAFDAPATVTDHVEEGTLVDDYPGVLPFDCPVAE
ncbi:MAG: pectin acetylesterase-family hydrolase [Candidatus Binatia bacterium]